MTSINSNDSVIPIEIIEAPKSQQNTKSSNGGLSMQTRSKPLNNNNSNSFHSNSTVNNSIVNSQKKKRSTRRSASPCSLVYVDSESASLSNHGNNKNDVNVLN